MGNPVLQWQMLARNPDAVATFYSALFGWQITADNAMGYRTVRTNATRGIDGGIWPIGGEGRPGVQLFVAVDDVPACVARVVELGGQVIIPHQVLPDGDEMAVVLDPDGMSLGLMKDRARDQSSENAVS